MSSADGQGQGPGRDVVCLPGLVSISTARCHVMVPGEGGLCSPLHHAVRRSERNVAQVQSQWSRKTALSLKADRTNAHAARCDTVSCASRVWCESPGLLQRVFANGV